MSIERRCPTTTRARDWAGLAASIAQWGRDLGFQEIGIADTDLAGDETRLLNWLRADRHGEMDYMARHGVARARPAELVPGTLRVISARMNYWPGSARSAGAVLADSRKAYVARYALRPRLSQGVARACSPSSRSNQDEVGAFGHRVFTDSAPVLEVALASQCRAGLARQAHAAADARGGLVLLPGRDLHRPAAADDAGGDARTAAPARSASPRAPPVPSSRRTSSTRGAASRI